MVMDKKTIKGLVVTMLNIRKDLIPCAWMFVDVHSQDIQNHPTRYLYFSIDLEVNDSQIGLLCFHH